MANFDLMRQLARTKGGKIFLLVMDGLGGLPMTPNGLTELETAKTPNMDRLAKEGSLGATIPVRRGITPGSGPAHLGLFGYDPVEYQIGRGILSALGVGLDVKTGDVAARGNFCTVDENGIVTDRRAGRIATDKAMERVEILRQIQIPGVEVEVEIEKEYRFVVVMRGESLSHHLADTDPQVEGKKPFPVAPLQQDPTTARTVRLFEQWVDEAFKRLQGHEPANGVLLRGFATDPNLPKYNDVYKLNAACVAVYPMYKGVSQLVGMQIIDTQGLETPAEEFGKVAEIWKDFDFVFCHIKKTDSYAEDGKFDEKVHLIEQVDAALPTILDLKPDVVMITGDHSTPAKLKSHSWHPVPLLLWAPATHMPDHAEAFGERACYNGALGQLPAYDVMQLALAHALRLDKFGA
ncbi:MAG: 2,3-bisphosphoglycerate-independent phosphoglycerate mutase [Anaerolineales bacterium]|nr:2,3-bisphosphoglycerate-independent phosphoglycerate mutase [Anaerolineales bacterium]